ncbi:unnamed protein product [Peronospora belbahrii]|uniref:Uncharacterized protein n=1 Tax=Peronospora belbahrii TaxID=622444 RepID=A0AAU9KJJ6_9STRA|nr:unnamed protein product [Peronospora belbahrii]CAH0520553.1 unnamed protein product [Peronospora belbahrii]
MSWLQTHKVSIPFHQTRDGKYVFAIQLQKRSRQDIMSACSRQVLQGKNRQNYGNKNGVDSASGGQITAMRSYSQFRKLWKVLTFATKKHSAALLSYSNSTGPTRVEHPLICHCQNWGCAFRSFHCCLKSYSFPSKFLIKSRTTSALETRRQGLELFVMTVQDLFNAFPRTLLQSTDALKSCKVLMALGIFFGFSEKNHANLALLTRLQLSPAQTNFGKRQCIRSDSAVSAITCNSNSRSGVDSCIALNINDDKDSCSKIKTSSAEEESMDAGVAYYLRDMELHFTNHKNIDSELIQREFQGFSVLPNDMCSNDNISSIHHTSTKYLTSPHRGSISMESSSHWIRCSRSSDARLHTTFLVRNPAVATRSCAATFNTKASRTLLPGLPHLLRTSEKTSTRSFLEVFKDHLMMDPRALGSSAQPIGDWNEDRQWELALYVASQIGHVYAVESILYRGPDPNAVMEDGLSSLQVACRGGHRSIVAMLLTNGADTNITDSNGVSPLLSAVQLGDHEIVGMLVEHGANVNLCNANSVSPVHVAVAYQTLPILRLLLKHDAFVNTKNNFDGKTPLHQAAQSGSLPMCKLLLNHGASIHYQTARGLNVVDVAKSHGHENIARYCLNFESNQKVMQHERFLMTNNTASASTLECSHEVRIVSEDGCAYAIL